MASTLFVMLNGLLATPVDSHGSHNSPPLSCSATLKYCHESCPLIWLVIEKHMLEATQRSYFKPRNSESVGPGVPQTFSTCAVKQ